MFALYSFAWKRFDTKSKVYFILTAVTALICSVTTALTPVLQKKLIEQITVLKMDTAQLVYLSAVSILGIAAMIIEALLVNRLVLKLQRKLQEELLGSALRNKNKIIASKGAGAYMVSVFGDSEQISLLLKVNVFNLLFHTVAMIIVLAVSMKWSLLFIEIVIPSYILIIAIQYLSNKYYIKYFGMGREKVYEANPRVLEYIENRTPLRGYANIEEIQSDLYELFDNRDALFKKAHFVNTLSASLINAVRTAAMILFFILSLFRLLDNTMQVSAFIALLSYFTFVFTPISMIKDFYMNAHKFRTVRDKISSSLMSEEHLAMPDNLEARIHNCTFTFDESKSIISKVSLALDKVVGIVGISGEGKTTIIKLLLGEICPASGECLFGNKPTDGISKYIIQTNIRYYGQDVEVFDKDVNFNITLGKIGLSQNEYAEMEGQVEAVADSCVDKLMDCKKQRVSFTRQELKLIQEIYLLDDYQIKDQTVMQRIADNFPKDLSFVKDLFAKMIMSRHYYKIEKYEALVSDLNLGYLEGRNLGQRGSHISGGEKNKVVLARFLLPEFGKLFILDEPFVNLDMLTEADCLKCVQKYCEGMRGIVISHKMNVIRDLAEQIYVIENGEIAGSGTHEALLQQDGLYQKLWKEYVSQANAQQ